MKVWQGDRASVLDYVQSRGALVEARLEKLLLYPETPPVIIEAMRYSLLGGGKRLRPVMAIASGEAVMAGGSRTDAGACLTAGSAARGGVDPALLDVACAIEMIHTYSLIHDDLPCMDNDDYRRGKPASHRVFGEAMALLAGDALLTVAFYTIACAAAYVREEAIESRLLRVAREVAFAAGPSGMVGGQALDMELTGRPADVADIERMHRLKTARLFSGAVSAGAIVAGASDEELASLKAFAHDFGLGFQIADDIDDAEREKGTGKASYVSAAGMEASRQAAAAALRRAAGRLDGFGEKARVLRGIAGLIEARVMEGAAD